MSRLCTARLYIFLVKVKNEMGGACSAYGGVYRVLLGKLERKRLLGRPRRKCKDYIKMDLQEVGSKGVWTGSRRLRMGGGVAGTCE
jgi:hypothetical protein